jgi:ribosomal protein L11 methylase PrmA
MRLTVRPTVFHPRYFISSERFAEFIDTLDLNGKQVIDVGTGTGILAIAAARAGAERVIATDINPNAALSVPENARGNEVGDRVTAV